ncbi:hypothetical protein [Actinoplanes solisilvae]|uniref:hypothetical protein n=1 Tax=Actinoplanes solisilvae TaxID=2486853 RepID=UPI000FD95B87|nr:hypothetical protein [Actinoplanes solisilvae]
MSGHRDEVLDHVLGLVAESSCADALVLRGSLTMPAWVGSLARPPGDIDWVVPPPVVEPCDRRAPYPFVDDLGPVQHWPEAVHGGAANEMWEFEEFDTGGQRPRVPPEGLQWISELPDDLGGPHNDLLDLLREHPVTDGGVEVGEPDHDPAWGYADCAGVRMLLPWHAPDGSTGTVQVDFAYDEVLPEPAMLTAVPRRGGRSPVGLWTAGPELSLTWKLGWLSTDQSSEGVSAAKDLYDAVLLAELPDLHLPPKLHALLADADLSPPDIEAWTIDGPMPGGTPVQPWLRRLTEALPPVMAAASPG